MKSVMTIAEVSKLVGLSPETIRHYEKIGILHPERDNESNYRYYTLKDICMLGKAHSYLQCGFSLGEAKEMLYDLEKEDVIEKFDENAEKLEQKLMEGVRQLQGIRKKQKKMNMVRNHHNRFSFKTRPAMYLLESFQSGTQIETPGLAEEHAQWFKRQIYTFPYVRWEDHRAPFETEHQIVQYVGMGIEESDLEASALDIGKFARYYPECPCVYSAMDIKRYNAEVQSDVMSRIDQFFNEHNIQQSGDILFETVFLSENEETTLYYRNVWIPYSQK